MKNDQTTNMRRLAVTTAAACLVTAAALDVLGKAGVETGLVYLPAIVAAAWYGGLPPAIGLSLLCLLLRWACRTDDATTVDVWSYCSWTGAWVIAAFLTTRWRGSVARERRLARTDSLTGLANRTALGERLDAELNRARRKRTPLTIAYVDCDRFKQVNDRLGHAVGDRVLTATASALEHSTRNYDVSARTGGDEFVVLLPETSAKEARAVVGRMHAKLGEEMRKNGWEVTFSIGVATFVEPPSSPGAAVAAADELMYAVKQARRNGVQFHTFGGDTLAATEQPARIPSENG